MSNITPIAFVDAAYATAVFLTKFRSRLDEDVRRQELPNSPHHDTKTLHLRGPKENEPGKWFEDVEIVDQPILTEWKSAAALLARIQQAAAPLLGDKPPILGRAMIVSLKPGGFVDWHIDEGAYAEAHIRLHLCLVPSPGAWTYVGGDAQVLPVGQLSFVNNRVLHSAANFGHVARIHLIADVRRPDAGEAPE